MSTTPLVTVRETATGAIRKINLDDLDETVEPVVPDVTPRATVPTKRDLDRAIRRALLAVLLVVSGCTSPMQPSPVCPEPVVLICEDILTHPIRQTYVRRCVDSTTGEVSYVPFAD